MTEMHHCSIHVTSERATHFVRVPLNPDMSEAKRKRKRKDTQTHLDDTQIEKPAKKKKRSSKKNDALESKQKKEAGTKTEEERKARRPARRKKNGGLVDGIFILHVLDVYVRSIL